MSETETANDFKPITLPLRIGDNFSDYPTKSRFVYIFDSSSPPWILAKDIYRPLAERFIASVNPSVKEIL
jgi:hypothetical protein